MQETDYAWLAGIIDGEGSIFVSKVIVPENRCGFTYRAQLTVSNTNEQLVRKVKEIIGSGTICHILETRNDWKDRYEYLAYGGTIRTILPKLMPYLVAKRLQAQKVLELLALFTQGTRGVDVEQVEKLYLEIKVLNTKGKLTPLLPKEVH
jgi:hypothetical protein